MFVPLHVKSAWSLGQGTATVAQLVDRATADGQAHVALTDVESLAGQVELHARARARGLVPITGLELQGAGARLLLLARDRAGYRALCRIVSRRRGARGEQRRDEDPVGALEAGPCDGLFVASDDPDTLARLVRGRRVDRSCLRALLVRPAPRSDERSLLAVARDLGLPLLASPDAVLLDAADHDLHRLLVAIRARLTVAEADARGLTAPLERALPPPARSERLFADRPDAVEETRRVAAACQLDLLATTPVLPRLDLAGAAPIDALKRRAAVALQAAREAGRLRGASYDERLARELAVIEHLGLAAYVLVVTEVVEAARARGVAVAARGSAAASLVLHVLGVTQVDPVGLGLLFERFLHEGRADLPDVDLDLPSDRRDEVIAWVFERFGSDRVAMVATHQTFQRRGAVRAGLLALGASRRDVDRYARKLPVDDLPPPAEPPWATDEDRRMRPPELGAPLVPTWLVPASHRALAPAIGRLVGLPRHLSVHPGGLAIADGPIEEHVPLERAPKGVVVAQFDLLSVARVGLVKLDLLGNRTLSELQDTIERLRDREEPLARDLVRRGLAAVPDDDPAALRLLDGADTIGCAQVESPAVRSVLARVPIRSLSDLVDVLAVVRPGAAAGEAKERFVRHARGEVAARSLHPRVDDVLAATHGVLLYEEQLIEVLARVGGGSRGEADRLRVALSDAQDEPATLARLERTFVARAAMTGVEADDARRVFAAVGRLVAYSFNHAHAASTAHLAYRAAFLRARFPVEAGCAVLEHHGGAYPLRTLAADLVRRGVALRPPCVNASGPGCSVERGATRDADAIRIGLDRIRQVADPSLARLLRAREDGGPFRDVADLVVRVRPTRRELEAFVRSGAIDALAPLSREGHPFAHEALLEAVGDGPPDPNRVPRRLDVPRPARPEDAATLAHFAALVRARDELRFLELCVSGHPLAILRAEASAQRCLTLADAAARPGAPVRVAAILSGSRRVSTRTGQVMQFVTLDDETGLLEALLFPGAYAAYGAQLTTPGPFLVDGRMAADGDDPHLLVSRLRPFHEREGAYARAGRR